MSDNELNRQPVALPQSAVAGGRLFANREEMVRGLYVPQRGRIAEIGVAFGDFSRTMIEAKNPAEFVGFDLFELHHVQQIWGRPSAEIFQGESHLEYYKKQMTAYSDRCSITAMVGDSSSKISEFPDEHFDLIYIDGDHTLDGVMRDARASSKKVKRDGLIIFNDYILYDHIGHVSYGIVHVVNEMCRNHGWRVEGFAFKHDMFCDIALSKRAISW